MLVVIGIVSVSSAVLDDFSHPGSQWSIVLIRAFMAVLRVHPPPDFVIGDWNRGILESGIACRHLRTLSILALQTTHRGGLDGPYSRHRLKLVSPWPAIGAWSDICDTFAEAFSLKKNPPHNPPLCLQAQTLLYFGGHLHHC